jgi:uncharacterized repeat protein (TIGR03803 family)
VGGKNCVFSPLHSQGCGTVFEITPTGKLTTLYSFCSRLSNDGSCNDGNFPLSALVLATNGNFYGTPFYGGVSYDDNSGTVFELTSAGKLTTLYSFCSKGGCPDGEFPGAGLIQARNGKFYGTTSNGADPNSGGTVFEITAEGKLTTLHRFCAEESCLDGAGPSGLVQGTDGNFYGVGVQGGTGSGCGQGDLPGCGVIFRITPAGKVTILHDFCYQDHCSDGALPEETLLQSKDGSFYGTTHQGGLATCRDGVGCGTIFRLSVGLGPFVQANPNFGQAEGVVDVPGNNLAEATP